MQINFARREIACKIVYYGPGMSGKTTNLEVLHAKTPKENKGELTCIATEGDRTLFFDFMPLNLGNIRGMNTKFQLYTVPGQVYYNSTRKLVLRGVDGVIFVADSSPDKMDENIESLRNLEENLRDYGRDLDSVSIIIQYNKRDRPDAVDVKILNDKLNIRGYPWFEAVATDGTGVFDSLKSLAGQVIQKLELHSAEGAEKGLAHAPTSDAKGEAARSAAPSGSPTASRSAGARTAVGSSATSPVRPDSTRGEPSRPAAAAAHGARKSAPRTRRPAASARPQGASAPKAGAGRSAGTAVATKPASKTTPRSAQARTQPVRRTTKTSTPPAKTSSSWVMPAVIVVTVLAAAGAAWKFFL